MGWSELPGLLIFSSSLRKIRKRFYSISNVLERTPNSMPINAVIGKKIVNQRKC